MNEVKYEFNFNFFDFLNEIVLYYLNEFIQNYDYLKDYLNITKLKEIETILFFNEDEEDIETINIDTI